MNVKAIKAVRMYDGGFMNVTKILVTHKHADHTGALQYFLNAKIYISRTEADAMKLNGGNIVSVDFKDGA